MSNALAIAGVTAVLQALLDSLKAEVTTALGAGVTLSSVAPEDVAQDSNSPPCLNLFLYQVTPNAALRNSALPSANAAGNRIARPPLALDLHYLLTAYGSDDLQAEVLLGYGMQVFHENPVLTRETVRGVLNPPIPPVPPIYAALATSDLAEQFELVKLSLSNMNLDEMSKLWTALKANFRPSAAYQATVVLIESGKPVRSPLPVLSRGPLVPGSQVDPVTLLPLLRESGVAVQGSASSPFPELDGFELSSKQLSAAPGDKLTFWGHGLAGVATQYRLLLASERLGFAPPPIGPEVVDSASDTAVSFVLAIPADNPAGIYSATVQVTRAGEPVPRSTNVVPLSIAPRLAANPLPASVALGGASSLQLKPTCLTQLLPGQRVSLILGDLEVVADPFTAPTKAPSFTFVGLRTGTYRIRLRVDGIDSVIVDRSKDPPVFSGPQLVVKP